MNNYIVKIYLTANYNVFYKTSFIKMVNVDRVLIMPKVKTIHLDNQKIMWKTIFGIFYC